MDQDRRDNSTLQRWLQERFDRVDDRVENATHELGAELKDTRKELAETRHAQRASMTQMAQQLVILVEQFASLDRRFAAVESKISEEGPIYRRLASLDGRVSVVEQSQASAGRFTWTDVWRTVAGFSALIAIIGGLLAVARLLSATGAA